MEEIKNFLILIKTPPYVHLLIFGFALFVLGIIGRFISGFRFGNKSTGTTVGACFSLIFMYVVAIAVFGQDAHLNIFSAGLPFYGWMSDPVSLTQQMRADFWGFCGEAIRVFFLTIIINSVKLRFNKAIARAKKGFLSQILTAPIWFFPWYFMECVVVFLAVFANYGIELLLIKIGGEIFRQWISIVVFVLIGVALLLLLLKLLFNTVAFFAKPFFKVLEKIITKTTPGEIISKAFVTTLILVAGLLILDHIGVLTSIMSIAAPATVFGPVILLLVCLAYITWLFCS